MSMSPLSKMRFHRTSLKNGWCNETVPVPVGVNERSSNSYRSASPFLKKGVWNTCKCVTCNINELFLIIGEGRNHTFLDLLALEPVRDLVQNILFQFLRVLSQSWWLVLWGRPFWFENKCWLSVECALVRLWRNPFDEEFVQVHNNVHLPIAIATTNKDLDIVLYVQVSWSWSNLDQGVGLFPTCEETTLLRMEPSMQLLMEKARCSLHFHSLCCRDPNHARDFLRTGRSSHPPRQVHAIHKTVPSGQRVQRRQTALVAVAVQTLVSLTPPSHVTSVTRPALLPPS